MVCKTCFEPKFTEEELYIFLRRLHIRGPVEDKSSFEIRKKLRRKIVEIIQYRNIDNEDTNNIE
jgi:hypothetical protein